MSENQLQKILWLEDQFEDLIDYSNSLNRLGYLVDRVRSVTDALAKLQNQEYAAYIFDLKVLPGDDVHWQNLDEETRKKRPEFDPLLGLELLRFLNRARGENNESWQKLHFDFSKVFIFSVVVANDVYEELTSFGVNDQQIIYKSSSDLDTLAEAISKLHEKYSE